MDNELDDLDDYPFPPSKLSVLETKLKKLEAGFQAKNTLLRIARLKRRIRRQIEKQTRPIPKPDCVTLSDYVLSYGYPNYLPKEKNAHSYEELDRSTGEMKPYVRKYSRLSGNNFLDTWEYRNIQKNRCIACAKILQYPLDSCSLSVYGQQNYHTGLMQIAGLAVCRACYARNNKAKQIASRHWPRNDNRYILFANVQGKHELRDSQFTNSVVGRFNWLVHLVVDAMLNARDYESVRILHGEAICFSCRSPFAEPESKKVKAYHNAKFCAWQCVRCWKGKPKDASIFPYYDTDCPVCGDTCERYWTKNNNSKTWHGVRCENGKVFVCRKRCREMMKRRDLFSKYRDVETHNALSDLLVWHEMQYEK
jgi:hypothetical protein